VSSLSRTILADLAAERLTRNPARSEARGLLALLSSGETADSLRKLIVCGRGDPASHNYRRQVLISFEIGLWQRNGGALTPVLRGVIVELARKGLSDRSIHARVPIGFDLVAALAGEIRTEQNLEAKILERLIANEPMSEVAHVLHIPIHLVRRISRKHHISFRKQGRGRKYSAATIAAMTAELKAGARPTDVCEKYGCTPELTKRIRLQFGDTLDRRDLRRVRPEMRTKVTQALAAGQRPTEIERTSKVSHFWLWHFRKHILHDSEDLRTRPLVIPEPERKQIAAELLAGGSIRAVARRFHRGYRQVKEIGFAVGWRPRKCRKFTPAERATILQLIGEGKSNGEIARALRCSKTVILQARRTSQWTTQPKAA
jgi:transposase-like protein